MSYRNAWLAATLAWAGAAAQAEILELVFDVSPTARQTLHVVGPGDELPWAEDGGFVPQSFSTTVRYDTASVRYASNEAPNGTRSAWTLYEAAAVSPTPYTDAMRASFAQQPDNFGSGQLYRVLPAQDPAGTPSSVQERLQARSGNGKQVKTDTEGTIFIYERRIDWSQAGPALLPQDFQSLGTGEIAQWLGSMIGTTVSGGYAEKAEDWTYKLVGQPGDRYMSVTPQDRVSWNGVRVAGDLTLRSVALVPEASTLTLLSGGLLAAGWAARRRTAV